MNLQSIAESLRAALSQGRQSATLLKSKLAELKAERAKIASAPLTREDTESLLLASLQRQCQETLLDEGLLRELTDLQGQGRYLIDMNVNPACTPLTPEVGNVCTQSLLLRIQALLSEPDAILARLKPALDRLDFSQAGRPLDKRRAKVATLDAEISRIQSELDSLETAIAGVSDVSAPTPSLDPAFGERRQIDGSWATWGSFYAGGKPGWVYDQ